MSEIMSTERVDIKIPTGLVIIVGKEVIKETLQNTVAASGNSPKEILNLLGKYQVKKETFYNTDGIVIYDSYCLSDSIPYLLQDNDAQNKIKKEEVKDIYICGHGNNKKPIISKLNMKKIAGYLVDNYASILNDCTKIHIMACYAKKTDMANELKQELVAINSCYNSLNIDAFSKEITLVAIYKEIVCAMDIKFKNSDNFYKQQDSLKKKLSCENMQLELSNYQSVIDSTYQRIKTDIETDNLKYMKMG